MDSTTGRYRLTTESGSQYIVDLDQNSLVRMRGAAPPSALDDDPSPSEPLRRDGRPVALVSIREATVGRSGSSSSTSRSPTWPPRCGRRP
ncbi:hypothetical protein GCM10025866_04260 [Naasia aerilata]|uniref:Uncharacterized protein n=2 Tax=Naasia aerilata TaxID=1162966 RepID=A0ABN6XI03_9MICO|nr:hypothetical protein GCM10025866_04260 [Naasia aerilata]